MQITILKKVVIIANKGWHIHFCRQEVQHDHGLKWFSLLVINPTGAQESSGHFTIDALNNVVEMLTDTEEEFALPKKQVTEALLGALLTPLPL